MCCEGRAVNISAMPTHGDTQRMGAAPPGTWHPQEEKGRAVVLHSQHPALQHRHLSSRSSHIQPPTICPKGWVPLSWALLPALPWAFPEQAAPCSPRRSSPATCRGQAKTPGTCPGTHTAVKGLWAPQGRSAGPTCTAWLCPCTHAAPCPGNLLPTRR